MCESKVSPKTQ